MGYRYHHYTMHGFLQLWEARKDNQHGRDSVQKQEKERTLLLQHTPTLYDQLDQFDHEDQRFFTTPIAKWEQKPNKDIQDWLLIAEPLTEKSKSRQETTQQADINCSLQV